MMLKEAARQLDNLILRDSLTLNLFLQLSLQTIF